MHRRPPRVTRMAACGAVLAAIVAGCSDDQPPPGRQDESSLSAGPAFESSAPASSASDRLLTYEEIGQGYVPIPYEPADPSVPAPCGGPSADAQLPPEALVGAEADLQAASVQVVEELRVYADELAAAAGLNALVAGLSCPAATLVGPVSSVQVTATVASPTQINVAAPEFAGSFVFARSGRTVVTVEVFAPPGSTAAPDPSTVVAAAVAKLDN